METIGGSLFAVAGAGESHGPAITTIVFGCPPGLELSREAIQTFLDRRRPGSNKLGTPRRESDKVVLLSGIYSEKDDQLPGPEVTTRVGDEATSTPSYEAGLTTGEPIAALVLSAAKRSADYEQFAGPRGEVRPGHTDLVKHFKMQGFEDPRGGGRSSFRSTTSDVVGGSVARLFLASTFGTVFFSSIYRVGSLEADVRLSDRVEALVSSSDSGKLTTAQISELEAQLTATDLHSIDAEFAGEAKELITQIRKAGDSIGAAIEVVAVNVPPLLGEPLYDSLKLRLMGVLGGLHAVQFCEIGSGQDVVLRKGSENNDPIRATGYQSNHHGGLIGGITTGMPIVCRVGFKPTSTIALPQKSVRKDLTEIDFELHKGRHDPCLAVRAGVTLESRMAIELMDATLAHQARRVNATEFRLF